jgi:predicted patatin/cPLA2 family phospholipase
MRKKRKSGWGVRFPAEKRRSKADKTAGKFPNVQKVLIKISSRAQRTLQPIYTLKNYADELIALAQKWKKTKCLEKRLKTVGRLYELALRTGANPFLVLVKATLPTLDRRRTSKIAAKIRNAVHAA